MTKDTVLHARKNLKHEPQRMVVYTKHKKKKKKKVVENDAKIAQYMAINMKRHSSHLHLV